MVGGTIELRLLGRFVVLRDEAEIPPTEFGGRKVRTLLRVLATRQGQFVPHDVLADALWGDRQPADPVANLQVLVNRARKATGRPGVILTGPGGYALSGSPVCVVDSERFLGLVADADGLVDSLAWPAYRAALASYGGEPLAEDRYSDWAVPYREQVARVHQEALERAAQLGLLRGEVTAAVEYAAAAAAAEPLREVAVLTLVRALAGVGDQAGALARYERYRRSLADELGLDPSPEALALQALLLQGGLSQSPAQVMVEQVTAPDRLRFVGRQPELAVALAELSDGGVVAVVGPSGFGKSRFVREVAAMIAALTVRAYWPERSEPWSVARALLHELLAADAFALDGLPARLRGAVAGLLPELASEPAEEVTATSRHALVIEALVRLMADQVDVTLILDDWQWADPTSVQVVAGLVERLPDLAVLLAYRPDELDPTGPPADLLRHQPRVVRVDLAGLGPADLAGLVADPGLAETLAEHTDRSPLAVFEVLRSLARDGFAQPDGRGCWQSLRADVPRRAAELGDLGQRRSLARRADRHAGLERDLLALIAVLARQVSAQTLAAALSVEQPLVLAGLSSLAAAGLVRLGEQGWGSAHDMVGEVVADSLAAADRARLHAALARALEAEGADPAEQARHLLAAGDAARSAAAYADAADRALETSAYGEAESLASMGLSVAEAPEIQSRLHRVRAEARRRRGDFTAARDDLRAALAAHPTGPVRATVLAQLARLASGADDLVRASELVELAIVEAGDSAPARAEALEVGSVLDMNLDRAERARQRSAEALALYQELGDSRGAARILDARAMATFLDGDIRNGTAELARAANLFEDSGDLLRLITPRSTQGHGLVFLGRPTEGLDAATAALEVARTLGHPEGQAYSLWHRSEALSMLGREDEAVVEARAAVAVSERLGHRGWTATAWRAVGIALEAAGDLGPALAAFEHSLEVSDNLDLFGCWAASRAALVQIALGRLDEAEPLVLLASGLGPPLGRYEARLAEVELAAARSSTATPALAREALRLAEAGGALAHVPRLAQLAGG